MIYARWPWGRTALMAAVTNPVSDAVIQSLLRAGADAQARAADGSTFPDYLNALLAEYPAGDFSDKIRRCQEVASWYVGGRSEQGAADVT